MASIPILIGDDAPFHLLVILADADGEPRAQFAVVKGVDHSEDLPLIEAQAIGRLLLVLKMGPDVERVTYVGLYNAPVHWEAKRFMALLFCGSDKKLETV